MLGWNIAYTNQNEADEERVEEGQKEKVTFKLLLQRLVLTMQPLKNGMPALTPYAYSVVG